MVFDGGAVTPYSQVLTGIQYLTRRRFDLVTSQIQVKSVSHNKEETQCEILFNLENKISGILDTNSLQKPHAPDTLPSRKELTV
jgi:hypothetical protein